MFTLDRSYTALAILVLTCSCGFPPGIVYTGRTRGHWQRTITVRTPNPIPATPPAPNAEAMPVKQMLPAATRILETRVSAVSGKRLTTDDLVAGSTTTQHAEWSTETVSLMFGLEEDDGDRIIRVGYGLVLGFADIDGAIGRESSGASPGVMLEMGRYIRPWISIVGAVRAHAFYRQYGHELEARVVLRPVRHVTVSLGYRMMYQTVVGEIIADEDEHLSEYLTVNAHGPVLALQLDF